MNRVYVSDLGRADDGQVSVAAALLAGRKYIGETRVQAVTIRLE
jgi:hypothetical protein